MTAGFERWELLARTALSDRGIGYHEATPLIEQARSDYEQSGADPWEALGPPTGFAADVAAAQPAAQASRDTLGKTARDHLSDGVFRYAFLGVPVSLLAMWVNGGLTIPLTAAGTVGVLLGFLSLFTVVAVPDALRAAGHPRLAPWAFVAAGALVIAAAAGFTELPDGRIGETSALGTLVVSLGLCWWLTRPAPAPEPGPLTAQASDPATNPAAGPASAPATRPAIRPDAGPASGPDAGASGAPDDPDAWFARLRALLVGRFDVPPGRAAALVGEARAHVAAAGSGPRDEFPSLEQYAKELADGEPRRQPPWWRTRAASRAGRIGMLVGMAVLVVLAVIEHDWWIAVTGTALLLSLATGLGRRTD
ncbi:hypothetical protein AB0F72_36505 [Actinoplanes sp. NPDC023936]|uniref:hypothetical protein n=1 Tax=Actinoplanes sp. NPDC023936 TaxID=3154910 RepID=UPI0033E0F5AF